GVNVIELNVAELTVSDAVPVALAPAKAKSALTVIDPGDTPLARPKLPELDPTVATAGALELHVTMVEISCVDESLNTPVAWKVVCPPVGMVFVEGEMEI